jgi:hypothetical protein
VSLQTDFGAAFLYLLEFIVNDLVRHDQIAQMCIVFENATRNPNHQDVSGLPLPDCISGSGRSIKPAHSK